MTLSEKELGITMAVLERFEKQTLPEALWIKKKVDKGELLSDGDIEFLESVLENINNLKGQVAGHPEWQQLYAGAINLYEEIIAKGLANQETATSSKSS
jgi:hypothetical protein